MSSYIEYNDKIAFHPGYYIKEIVEESGLTQEDFAKRLNTTPKNLCVLLKGEQRLSVEIAAKLSRMLGTSIEFWLNLQQTYDAMQAEFYLETELEREREVFNYIDYGYFVRNFKLSDCDKNINAQIGKIREFLKISSLCVLKEKALAVNFRCLTDNFSEQNIINANAMVQTAINKALEIESLDFSRRKLESVVDIVLKLNKSGDYIETIKAELLKIGVVLIVLPELHDSGIIGATKKIDGRMMIMVTDKGNNSDDFLFTLLHEIGHVINCDYGITIRNNQVEAELAADEYARMKILQ